MRVSVKAWNDHEKDWERELIQNIQLDGHVVLKAQMKMHNTKFLLE